MFGVMVRVNTTQNLKDRPTRRQCTMTCDAHITPLIMAQSVKTYGTFLWCNNRLFSMVTNTICVHIIIVRGKLGVYHENNTSMSIIL